MIARALLRLGLASITLAACASFNARGESLDVAQLPETLRPNYEVFAHRCSKCHPLSRALNSGIDDDDYWVRYVARMRRQPSSGISPEDGEVILEFLRYYAAGIREKKAHPGGKQL